MDAASLRTAVCSLYGSAGEDLARANAWLNSFSQTPAAWEACLQLLDPSERPEVTFFCANLLLSKVRSGWHKLSPDQAATMGTVIRYACYRRWVEGSCACMTWQAGRRADWAFSGPEGWPDADARQGDVTCMNVESHA